MTFVTFPETRYDPKEHKIESEDRYRTPMGEVVRQVVNTNPSAQGVLKNMSCYYRWTLNEKQIAWGKDHDDAAKQTLLTLLAPFEIKTPEKTRG